MKKFGKICLILSLLLVSNAAMAVSATWVNWTGNQDWSDGGNWNQAGIAPGAGDEAHFNVAGLAAAIVSTTASIDRVVLDNDGEIDIAAAGDLSISGQAVLGNSAGSTGNIVVDGGQLSVGTEFGVGMTGIGNLTVNSGTVNANGGWLIAGYGVGSTGSVELNAGQINVAGAHYVGHDGDGSTTINGGVMAITGQLIIGFNAGTSGVVTINDGELSASAVNLNTAGSSTLILNGGKLINNGGFDFNANSSIIIAGGEFVFAGSHTVADVEWLTTNPEFDFGVGTPTVTDNGDGTISLTSEVGPIGTFYWVGRAGAGDPDWTTALNWIEAGLPAVPGVGSRVNVTPGDGVTYGPVVSSAQDSDVLVVDNGIDGAMTIAAGGSLTATSQVLIGNPAGVTGSLIVDGQLDAGGVVAVSTGGTGYLTVNETGVLNVAQWLIPGYNAGGTGSVELNGGVINVLGAPLYIGHSGDGLVTVNSGTINLSSHLIMGTNPGSSGTLTMNGGELSTIALNLAGDGSGLAGGHGPVTVALYGGKLINTGGVAYADNVTIIIDGGELVFAGGIYSAADIEFQINTYANWEFGDGSPIVVTNDDGSVSVFNELFNLFDINIMTFGNMSPVLTGPVEAIFNNPSTQFIFDDSDVATNPQPFVVEWTMDVPATVDTLKLKVEGDAGVPNRAVTDFKLLAKTYGSATFDVELLHIPGAVSGDELYVPYPYGNQHEIDVAVANTSYFKEFRVEFMAFSDLGARVLYIGAEGAYGLEADLNIDGAVDSGEVLLLASDWLTSNLETNLLPDYILDDYEGYANEAALDASYVSAFWATGTSSTTLITAPAESYEGNQAMSWVYDVNDVDPVFAETIFLLDTPVDLSNYDEFKVMINRHVDNGKEYIFYVRFLNGGYAQSNEATASYVLYADGSTQTPTGWNEWIVDLNQMDEWRNGYSDLSQITDVQGIVIGVTGGQAGFPESGLVPGVIDFDNMKLIDNISCQLIIDTDLNADCIVNLQDLAIVAQQWLLTY